VTTWGRVKPLRLMGGTVSAGVVIVGVVMAGRVKASRLIGPMSCGPMPRLKPNGATTNGLIRMLIPERVAGPSWIKAPGPI
jgi:hypothetical protein